MSGTSLYLSKDLYKGHPSLQYDLDGRVFYDTAHTTNDIGYWY